MALDGLERKEWSTNKRLVSRDSNVNFVINLLLGVRVE